MFVKDNPFYILRVPMVMPAIIINDYADCLISTTQAGFADNRKLIEDAEKVLLSPTRRVEAELNWFPEYYSQYDLEYFFDNRDEIFEMIDSGGKIEIYDLRTTDFEEAFPTITLLNCMIYNLFINPPEDISKVKWLINCINQIAETMTLDNICSEINDVREEADFPQILEQDVEFYMRKKKHDLKCQLNELLWV